MACLRSAVTFEQSLAPIMSKFQLMRFLFALIFGWGTSASPLLAQESSSTIPPAAAESGKDVVHALNNAFAKVFEIVAPSVVIIEVSKKNDGNEGLNFDDLFFPGQPDDNSPRRSPVIFNRLSEGRDLLCGRTDTSSPITTSLKGRSMWTLS